MLLIYTAKQQANFWFNSLVKIKIISVTIFTISFCLTTEAKDTGTLSKNKNIQQKATPTNSKIYFKSEEVSAHLNNYMIEARKKVDVKFKETRLKTEHAYLYFNKDKSLAKIVAPTQSTITKKDLKIYANELTYHLQTQTITSKGSTKIERKGSQITGRNIKYNLLTDELIGEDISGIL